MKHKKPVVLSKNIVITDQRIPNLRGKVISDDTPDAPMLRTSLLKDWGAHGKVDIDPVADDDTFLIRFHELDDLLKVWRGAPWLYQHDLFLMQPDTGSAHAPQFRKAGFWVKFHGLTPEYLSSSSASALACRVGEPIEFSTVVPQTGGVLEVLVQIDITKPMVTSLSVVLQDGSPRVVSLEYRGLPRLCELCRVPGHQLKNCRKTNRLKLVLKNFLCPCLPRYRSQNVQVQACARLRATARKLEHTSPTGHTSNNRSDNINREHTCDVSNHLMTDGTPSTSSVIQVPADLTMQDSTQAEDGQMDVSPADSGGASSAGEPGQSPRRSCLPVVCPCKMMLSSPLSASVQTRMHGRARATAPGSREVAQPLPADQAFHPLGKFLQDYSVQLRSYYSTQGPSYLQHIDVRQLYSDLGATERMTEPVFATDHFPKNLITLAFKSIAAQTGVCRLTATAGTDRSVILVNGIGLDAVMILKYLRRHINRAARSNLTPVSVSNTETSVTCNVVIDMLSSSVFNSRSRLDMSINTEPNSSPARFLQQACELLPYMHHWRYGNNYTTGV